ncbi:MAG: hypothetical protein L6R28_24500 [Planctomycetes bacterium]|nr:hypothetical protein [Planctomycetota bacterium]
MRTIPLAKIKSLLRLQRGTWIVLALTAAGLIYVNAAERVGRIEVLASPGNPNWEWSEYFMVRGWPFHFMDRQPNPKWSAGYLEDRLKHYDENGENTIEPRFIRVFNPVHMAGDVLAMIALLAAAAFLMEWRRRARLGSPGVRVAEHAA